MAGSANNQLADPGLGAVLANRGILYAPDYVVNGGGAMAGGLVHQGITDQEELERRVSGIGRALDDIFEESVRSGVTPDVASDRRVRRILEAARA